MREFLGLRAKTYSYLINGSSEGKKVKDRKKCAVKRKLKFDNYLKTILKKMKLMWNVFKKVHEKFIKTTN